MADIIGYKIQQIIDNGPYVQITLTEDVQLEPVSQKQLVMESVSKKLDQETKQQVMPLLEAILQSQPTIKIKQLLKKVIIKMAAKMPTVIFIYSCLWVSK